MNRHAASVHHPQRSRRHDGARAIRRCLYALALITTAACKPPPIPAGQEVIRWQPRFRGVELTEIVADAPRPLHIHAARIDLRDPAIRLRVSPGLAADAPRPPIEAGRDAEVLSSYTRTFLDAAGCQLAFNASAYAPVVDDEGLAQDVEGLAISNGVTYSQQRKNRDMMLIDADKHIRFARMPVEVSGVVDAAAGFEIVLADGEVNIRNPDIHPRTAVGVSRDGQTLLVLAIDGRQPGYSEGVTLAELGGWLRRLGAWDGLNLDGGGSTTLVVRDGEHGRTLNRPIHRKRPGLERPSANHVCVFAAPLP